jgi:hypothetical protein
MREIGKFYRTYCNENHKTWAELLPHIESWINHTVASSRGYTPGEIMYGSERCNVISKLVPNLQNLDQEEGIEEKLEKAYCKMRNRAEIWERRRKLGNAKWEPKMNEKVLIKTQPVSEAVKGIKAKFTYLYEGPFLIGRILGHSAYEVKDERGKVRVEFNKKQLKRYKEEAPKRVDCREAKLDKYLDMPNPQDRT